MSEKESRPMWQDEVIRMGGTNLVKVLEDIRDAQDRTCQRIIQLEQSIGTTLQDHIRTAFAGADPDGHRRAHEAMITQLEETRRLRVAIQEKTMSGLIWALMIWVGLQVLSGVKQALGIH